MYCARRLFGFTPDRLAQIRAAAPAGEYYDAVCACGEDADCAAFLQTLAGLRAAAGT